MDITDQVQDSVAKAKEKVLEDLDFMNLGKTRAVFFIQQTDTLLLRPVCVHLYIQIAFYF